MNNKISELIYELISAALRPDSDQSQNLAIIAKELETFTGQSFGYDIERWVTWYMSDDCRENRKAFVQSLYRLYKANLRARQSRT